MKIRLVSLLAAMFVVTLLPSCAIPVPGGVVTVGAPCVPLGVARGPMYVRPPIAPSYCAPVGYPYGYPNARSYGTGMFRNNSCGPLGASWQAPWSPPMNNGPTYYRSPPMPHYIQVPQYHPRAPFQP